MDSLKVPKGSGKPTGSNISLAIRFNAFEESIDDILRPNESLSNSPQHANSDDTSWRKEFLQGSFFNRKRSGSIDGPSTGLIGTISSSEGKTWKMIKGKVTQAMEDIKSTKHDHAVKGYHEVAGDESDLESTTINSSISDDFCEAQTSLESQSLQKVSLKKTNNISESDSDNDVDSDIFNADQDSTSIIRKSFVNLRNKNRTILRNTAEIKQTTSLLAKLNKPKNPSDDTTSPSKTSFLRRRVKKEDSSKVSSSKTSKKDVEIESGVEMLEDMILHHEHAMQEKNPETSDQAVITREILTSPETPAILDSNKITTTTIPVPTITPVDNSPYFLSAILEILQKSYIRRILFTGITFCLLSYFLSIPPFVQGVFACLFTIMFISSLYDVAKILVDKAITNNGIGPEKCKFQIPDFNSMPICEIPAAEEHKSLKTYSGWMNEINNYDPNNYHISMTRTVFVKLDGSVLRLSNTTTRIPKRSMWNETLPEKKNIIFTRHRFYNLTGCRIEMCPKGLARKRHFSRKYPIQLLIPNSKNTKLEINSDGYASDGSKDLNELAEKVNKVDSDNDSNSLIHQSSNESMDDKYEKMKMRDKEDSTDIDFGATIMNCDVSSLQNLSDSNRNNIMETAPYGDDVRILLFARSDREKEDWYRRFNAASIGAVTDTEFHIPDLVILSDDEITSIKLATTITETTSVQESSEEKFVDTIKIGQTSATTDSKRESVSSIFEGLLMTTCAARSPTDYIKFMSRYQQACSQIKIPVVRTPLDASKKSRREKKQEDELWKGIDQSLYLGPSSSVVWANVLAGRILFSCLNDAILLEKIQEFLQKKLSAIRLPGFMEDVNIAKIHLGDTPPLIHRVSQPMLDERGTWIDADVTYEGLMHMTITTKLNLLRLKKQQQNQENSNLNTTTVLPTGSCAIYDSNAESSGASSSESESPTQTNAEIPPESQSFYSTPGSSRRILRIVDRITASNLFQSATEISYIQRAMENMSTKITLTVELKGLVSRVTINMPPPPSDRIWIGFRGPPRLWITAKPAVGDHTFDWSIVTNVIENKLCDEVYKYLVYPNMVDIIVPFLGQSTYKE